MQKYDFALIFCVACVSLWSVADIMWFEQRRPGSFTSVSTAEFTGFIISSTGHTDCSTTGSTFASVAPPAKSEVSCRVVDMSCRCVMQHRARGEGSLSGHCLPSDTSRLAACCRVRGQKLLLSCCCIANHRANPVLWRLLPR